MLTVILATTQVICATGWTGASLEADINKKLIQLEISVDESKLLQIKDIKITPEFGYAFIIYEVKDHPVSILPDSCVYPMPYVDSAHHIEPIPYDDTL